MNTDDPGAVLVELMAREPIFHRLELGTTRADFEAQTADDFWEVGASGRVYDRETVWATLRERYSDPTYAERDHWVCSGAACRQIAGEAYLVTYVLEYEGRITRRSTLWQRHQGSWRILYHQGTVVETSGDAQEG